MGCWSAALSLLFVACLMMALFTRKENIFIVSSLAGLVAGTLSIVVYVSEVAP